MFPPDGLLTSGQTKYDVKLDPHIIAPDPFAADTCLDDLSLVHQLLLKPADEQNTMNPGADETSSGLNGRLRPRKSNISSPQSTKSPRRSETRTSQDKVKRTSTPTKTPPNKPDDLTTKSDTTLMCPYCDRKFASKQTLSKHIRRLHGSSSKQDSFMACLFCSHYEAEAGNIVRHMAESHAQQYFACLNCHTRYPSSSELAEHKNKTCDLKLPYRSKLRRKVTSASSKETQSILHIGGKDDFGKTSNAFTDGRGFNGIVISCEPSQVRDGADIEDNITTNLILPPSKGLGSNTVVEKNAVIVLDDINWNKRIPPNFSFHNTDADQILSRLGVVHRSPRTGESSKRDWKTVDDSTQKFEKCFDTSFYSKVASNVQENLSKFLDGSFNFNPDPDSTIKTRKSKNSVQINTAEGFPILLASEQYSRNAFDRYMPRAIAPKHKWKWDNLESEKSPINPDQIKRDSHTNNCIITLVSSLDIWTQLRMRSKFEEKFGGPPLEKKTEKQTIISNELKDILESRELPATSSQAAKVSSQSRASSAVAEFPASLGLGPSTSRAAPAAAVLSGEWVRPRCYVCCACGAQNADSRLASTHASTHHPNAQVQHYEIVGEQLLNADILKHLYVPPGHMCNRTRPPRGIRECTKCSKPITLEDLHQHMLDCAGDTPAVRKKCRYRPFGVRRRRPRLPDNTIRKKIRKDIRTRQTRPKKSLLRPRPIRTEVGDAETIRKMIADLPAKRHRVPINPNNAPLRPRIKQRPNLVMKRRSTEDYNKRKKSNTKEVAITNLESPENDEMSAKSDDDKPLKPNVKRVASRTIQRTDSEKRSAMGLKRPKRKRLQAKEEEKNDHTKTASNFNSTSKAVTTEELPIENSPKKVDIHSVDFKAKEHVGRGNSSNHDGQRPGCSGQQNANSQNQCAPVQNVPLKHSIARLTADSEKHDKSVQFHHLFLVQQECNNVNQHVHSRQELLFENEAAVLTPDKPPLPYSSRPSQDLQKNKLNKPRKGLNACIAMLKNKLVEPTSNSATIPTGHVSVQCGDDEPLYIKPDPPLPAPLVLDCNNENTVLQDYVTENSVKPTPSTRPRSISNQEKIVSGTNSDSCSKPQKPATSSAHVIKQITQSNVITRESSRRKSLISESKIIEVTNRYDLVTRKDSTEPTSSKIPLPNSSLLAVQSLSNDGNPTLNITSLPYDVTVHKNKPASIASTNKLDSSICLTHKENSQNVASTHKGNSPNLSKQTNNSLNVICTLKENSHSLNDASTLKDNSPNIASTYKSNSPNSPTYTNNLPNVISSLTDNSLVALTLKDNSPNVASKHKSNTPNSSTRTNNSSNVISTLKDNSLNVTWTLKDNSPNLASTHKGNSQTSSAHTNNSPNVISTLKDNSRNVASTHNRNAPNSTTHVSNSPNIISTLNDNSLNVASTHNDNTPHVASIQVHKHSQPNEEKLKLPIQEIGADKQWEQVNSNDQAISHIPLNKPYDLSFEETETHDEVIPTRLTTDLDDAANHGQGNHYVDSLSTQQQTSLSANCDSSNRVTENYPDTDFNHLNLTVNIRPAHASTNVESMVAIPLDLSGKVSNIINTQQPTRDNAYLLRNTYETYETLDLSSKNQDVSHRPHSENMTTSNEIVDLSVKPSTSRSTKVEVTRKDDVTDLSLRNVDSDIPTDLTVKKKGIDSHNKGAPVKTYNMETTLLYDEAVGSRGRKNESQVAYKSPTNISVLERISDSENLTSGGEKLNTTDKASKGKLVSVVHQPKSRNLTPSLGKKSEQISEKISSNFHAEDERNVHLKDSSLLRSQIMESVPRKNCDDKKNVKYNVQPIDSRTYDQTSIQKPIYDPTLKIPQYRIRATASCDASATTDLPINTSSPIVHAITAPPCGLIPNYTSVSVLPSQEVYTTSSAGGPSIGIKERKYGFGSADLSNVTNVTNSSSGSISSDTNFVLSTQLSDLENTTPVYTLANSCISVTKIECTNSITLTGTLLKTDTKIANTTPVCTLAGASVDVVAKHSKITSPSGSRMVKEPAERSFMRDKLEERNMSNTNSGSSNTAHSKEINEDQNLTNVANPLLNAEHDLETARKIALLPKELLEILGNMPVDHRNQLLNVLPQYVATPTSVSSLQGDLTKYSESSKRITTLQTFDQKEITVPSALDIREPERLNKSPLVMPLEENEHVRTLKSISKYNYENKSPNPVLTHHTLTLHNQTHLVENTKSEDTFTMPQHENTKEEPLVELSNIHTDVIPKDSFPILTSNRMTLCRKSSTDKVIDLTEDEIVSRLESHSETALQASPPLSLVVQPKRNKPSNDQTASLRAVRIKAPSERKKSVDNQLSKQTTPAISNKMSIEQENEVKNSLDANVSLNTDITLAIQQAEISSTQHSNKNVISECKSASSISPNAQESIGVSKEAKIIEEIKENPSICTKSTLVTSSILNNAIAQECIKADVKNCNSLINDFSSSEYLGNVMLTSESSDSHKDKNSELTLYSSLATTTKPFQLPSTANTTVLNNHKECTINDNPSNIREDEDSDDDLSLAVICLQKQKRIKKVLTSEEDVQNKETNPITKRPKKTKKKTENTNTVRDFSIEKTSCNNNIMSPITLNETGSLIKYGEPADGALTNCAEMEETAKLDENIKNKKSRHNRMTVDRISNSKHNILSRIPTNGDDNNGVAETRKNENDKILEKVSLNNEKDDQNNFVEALTKPLGHVAAEFKLIPTNNQLKPTEENIVLHEKHSPIRQKNKKKKRSLISIPSGRNFKNKEDSVPKPIINKMSEFDVNEMVLHANEKSEINCLDNALDLILSDSLHSKDATTISNNVPITDVLSPGIKHQDIDGKNVHLRRSRRGKSSSNSVEYEDTLQQAETLQENKTPLTKKQLIFSKLLLDEENNTKQPEGITGSENRTTIIPLSQIDYAEKDSVENIIIDINKPTKRKKSSHQKRKYKKKKSINDRDFPDESNQPMTSQIEPAQIEMKHRDLSEQTTSHEPLKLESKTFDTLDTEISVINKVVTVTSEKRKSGDVGMEDSPISMPKKSKLSQSKTRFDLKTRYVSESNEEENNENNQTDNSLTQVQSIDGNSVSHAQPNISSDKTGKEQTDHYDISSQNVSKANEYDSRVKTCYNMPVANKRTRSKSTATKLGDYDPYDIDMDDMIESTEPRSFRHRKTSSDQKLLNSSKRSISSKKIDFEVKILSKESFSKSIISDSDDSSKSDVPLKKYVEKKEKKINKLEESDLVHKNNHDHDAETSFSSSRKQDYFTENRNKRILGITKTVDGPAQDDTEEELRSEQFMESFGFFSERKPRKSNLLATKKISETFHIIANECDDMYFGFKDKSSKKSIQNENRKSIEGESNLKSTRPRSPPAKKNVKRGRKKKISTVTTPSYCHICKKEFRRPDNYVRHQMTLFHVSKLSEVELKVKTVPIQEEPNYLLAYKEHLDRMKVITDKMTKRKKNSKSAPKIIPLTLEEILADVNKIVREQQLSQRGLSCDEELFLDCCELLKESHKKPDHAADIPSQDNSTVTCPSQSANTGLDFLGKCDVDNKCDSKNDGDVDSITAKTILESEEVRNLENDLISGLKEAANASSLNTSIVFQHTMDNDTDLKDPHPDFGDNYSSPNSKELPYEQEPLDNFEESEELNDSKTKKYPDFKEKMYPDIEEIDMFEDKFDKIKRKCRSQAAAAKQAPLKIEPSASRKGRKKSEKRKGKKGSKRNHTSTVLTKGALKGFDGIKVSIPTSDINISAIVSPLENSHKRRKKGYSKKRREIKNSESSSKYDSDHQTNERSVSSKNVDVYEFMDNEDVELFEFRPSTLMERFKSISNKENPSTSKVNMVVEVENSSTSASDGDDFVYMSDDYVCSDEETENSLMSCDVTNTKIVSDVKKLASQMKRRDVIEKNAVMGKIFKNNAVRSERKVTKSKESVKAKANLDQLFDSLLEEEPSSSMLNDESLSLKDEVTYARGCEASSPTLADALSSKYTEQSRFQQVDAACPGKDNNCSTFLSKRLSTDNEDEITSLTNNGSSTCKITMKSLMGEHRRIKHRKRHSLSPQESVSPNKFGATALKDIYSSENNEEISLLLDNISEYHKSNSKIDTALKIKQSKSHEELLSRKIIDDIGVSDYSELCYQSFTSDETGVARQRARRKCTVGKQNILAESWSSESEPDGEQPRARSVESTVSAAPRKKRGKKKDGQHTSGRRGNNRHISFKKHDIESRVTISNSNRNTTTHTSGASSSGPDENINTGMTDAGLEAESGQAVFAPPAPPATPSTSAAAGEPAADDDAAGGRFRTLFFWTAEGATQEQQLRQQHGWIVGDSHKKLVTMLAQAKRRKRNNDDKRHLVE